MIARIYETFPLLCPRCQKPLRFIAFLTAPDVVRPILISLNEDPDPPPVSPARDPPEPQPGLVFGENVDKMFSSDILGDAEFDQRPPGWDENEEPTLA